MKIIRSRIFSDSVSQPEGVIYYPAQVGEYAADYLVEPLDRGLGRIENIPIIKKSEFASKKIRRFRGITEPLNKLLRFKKEKNKSEKKK